MTKRIAIVLAEGFEEIEAVVPADVLRRAGLDVVVCGLKSRRIRGAHGIEFGADMELKELNELPEAVVLPGGLPGAENLAKSDELRLLLEKMNASKRLIAAICATPGLVLAPQGILDGRKATCYPGFEKNFPATAKFSAERVVEDAHVVTSRGPGTAFEFALILVKRLAGEKVSRQLSQGMII